jgi:hypothetical protein
MQERGAIADSLQQNGFYMEQTVPHDQMMHRMSQCVFCACPKGLGIDTHRLWESLAAGCAAVATDWLVLRCRFRGSLPAVWVREHTRNKDVDKSLDTEKFDLMDGVFMDEFGDVFLERWSDVTRSRLRRMHRFVGWKRSSLLCRSIVQSEFWISQILKAASM